ncbi:hypothetical protein FCM35_KLT21643 [Carex littledalei]|uniref:Uncharacterized protein n=1 Tax=Carex littledalei TaxID=544730 RepID=A0A833VVP2_9POAL|nr:hypothetical protein FCM35_KLT21643 [Carex littledalei]
MNGPNKPVGVLFSFSFSFAMESTESAPKKRKLAPRRDGSSRGASDKDATTVNTSVAGMPSVDLKIKEAKKFAVIQAQQEACLGNYRSFDSLFGNFLVPVIPTREDLLQ